MESLTRRCSKSTATSQRQWATALVTKVGPQPTVSASPGSLLKMPILRLPESETMGPRRGTAMCDRFLSEEKTNSFPGMNKSCQMDKMDNFSKWGSKLDLSHYVLEKDHWKPGQNERSLPNLQHGTQTLPAHYAGPKGGSGMKARGPHQWCVNRPYLDGYWNQGVQRQLMAHYMKYLCQESVPYTSLCRQGWDAVWFLCGLMCMAPVDLLPTEITSICLNVKAL